MVGRLKERFVIPRNNDEKVCEIGVDKVRNGKNHKDFKSKGDERRERML
jgi:hypothetical protein